MKAGIQAGTPVGTQLSAKEEGGSISIGTCLVVRKAQAGHVLQASPTCQTLLLLCRKREREAMPSCCIAKGATSLLLVSN